MHVTSAGDHQLVICACSPQRWHRATSIATCTETAAAIAATVAAADCVKLIESDRLMHCSGNATVAKWMRSLGVEIWRRIKLPMERRREE